MRELAHHFPPAQLTVISLDEEDSDDTVWRRFIAEHNMDWVQVRDKGSELYFRFGLSPISDLSLPRYVFIDRQNSVLHVYNGTDRLALVAGQIIKTIDEAAPHIPQTAAPSHAQFRDSQ
jgi:hypothetical protein